jgi:3'-5' exonuclease
MLSEVKLENILFLDIETVSTARDFNHLSPQYQELWIKKSESLKKDSIISAADIYSRAGIYAEFGKIICISTGYFSQVDGKSNFRIKSFYGHDEKEILLDFANLLNQFYSKKESNLCAHNGKEFDFPYISRRMIINGVQLPALLNIAGKKPWEICLLDTMELWKFGDYKNYTSLNLLASILNIPTPKDDIDGSQVNHVYWEEKNLERIAHYCQKDVLTVAQILLKFKGQAILQESDCTIVEPNAVY